MKLVSAQNKSTVRGVVMGISKYQNVPSLRFADKDAMSFYDYLLSPAGGKADTNNIRILLNEKATSYNFFEAMDNLLDAAKEGDLVYIYFAGHGDIEKKTERQNGYLICYSSPANCYAAGGSINVRDLQDYVSTIITKNKSKVFLIVDACRSGKLAGGSEGSELTALALKSEWNGVTKILSCQPGETSLESEKWGGGAGVFTFFLLKGLKGLADENGDGKVSVRELYNYLDKNVNNETHNKQMPEVVGEKRQDLAKVDKQTYLEMLNNPERISIMNKNQSSAGFEADMSSINDVDIIKVHEKFKEYIKIENLIAYNETESKKETAISIFRSLENNINAKSIIKFMKRELLAALQNKAQIQLNNELKDIEDTLDVNIIYKDLKAAFEIVDSNYNQYNFIKTRFLYYRSLITDDKDSTNKLNLLRECIKLTPDFPEAFYEISETYISYGHLQEALNNINLALNLSKNWAWAFNQRAYIYLRMRNFDQALTDIDKAIQLKPDGYQHYLQKGNILHQLNKLEEAIILYDRSIELNPNLRYTKGNKGYAFRNKGQILFSIKKYEEAIKCFDNAIELLPFDYTAWYYKGYSLGMLGKYEEAIKCNLKVIAQYPQYEAPCYNTACFYSLLKNKEKMLIYLKKSIELKIGCKEEAKKDTDFKAYWDDPDFKKLVE